MKNRPLHFLVAAFLCVFSIVAVAQDYPAKPVKLVLGYPAGGALDVFARGLAEHLQARLKQTFVVENRPGATENVAANYVAKAPADGYTLFVCTEAPLASNQFLYKTMSYDPAKDLKPISLMARVPLLMAASPTFPAKDAKEFAAVARTRANNPVAFASGGVGGSSHLPIVMLAKNEGFAFNHVPYNGIPPLIPDLSTGRVDAVFGPVSVMQPFVKDNVVKAMAVQGEARLKSLPNVPTFKELGLEDIKAQVWFALVGPGNMPDALVARLATLTKEVLASPEFLSKYVEPFSISPIGTTPAEFASFIVSEREYQRERVRLSGAKMD
jgi:tripartite-type tricarboxylate transporter receptor subunit TctC